MSEVNLEREVSAFHRLLPGLRASHRTGWIVMVGEDCQGRFATFEEAADFALGSFADTQFLIRHTDEPPAQVPFVVEG